jgi:UTP--glucose-1-phosphate uridylyltransferase
MKAVIPAAGLGTRFLPITKNNPKEMLPIIDKPAIQYVVEEAVHSGIHDIIIVTGRGKGAIENHFDRAYELESVLKKRKEFDKLKLIQNISELADIFYVRQKTPLGLGHAVLAAHKHIGNEPFAVLLGDDIIVSNQPCLKQMMNVYHQHNSSVIAIQHVKPEHVSKYGIIEGNKINDNLFEIKNIVEKPQPEETSSTLAVMGRYILSPNIFDCIKKVQPGKNNEIQLTDALNMLIKKEKIFGYLFDGKRFDLGDKFDWLRINFELAYKQDEFKNKLNDLFHSFEKT